jgi:hypothetical protein
MRGRIVVLALFWSVLVPHVAVGQAENIPKCADWSISKSTEKPGSCSLSLKDAPKINSSQMNVYFSRDALQKLLKGKHVGCLTCEVSFAWYYMGIQHIDFAKISDTIKSKLTESGEEIAFNGLSSGEMLITTVPKVVATESTHYEVLLVTQHCERSPLISEGEMTCGIIGSARKFMVASKNSSEDSTDKLCHDIEGFMSDYFYSIVQASEPK